MYRYYALLARRRILLVALLLVAALLVIAAILIPVLVLRRRPTKSSLAIKVRDCDPTGGCRIDNSVIDFGDDTETISFQLAQSGDTIRCVHQQFGIRSAENTETWHGMCSGGGNANLLKVPGITKGETLLHGSVVDAAKDIICQLSPNAEGVNKVLCTPGSQFPPELDPVDDKEDEDIDVSETQSDVGDRSRLLQNHQPFSLPDLTTYEDDVLPLRGLMNDECANHLDILVLWSTNAECRNSELAAGCTLNAATERNMRGLIDLAVMETNAAFQASGISTALRLVHAYHEPRYAEPANNAFHTTVRALRSTSNSVMDDVRAKRAQFGADLVAMIIDDDSYCGIGFPGPEVDKMFSVTYWYCIKGRYSFAHEVGHNLGCRHDRNADNTCSAEGFNYGYRDPKSRFRSIMAYDCSRVDDKARCDNNPTKSCARAQMFSNVGLLHNGEQIGNAAHDNARQINSAATLAASYYPCRRDVVVPATSSPTIVTSAPTSRSTLAATFPAPTRRPTPSPTQIRRTLSPTETPTLVRTPRPSVAKDETPFPTIYSSSHVSIFHEDFFFAFHSQGALVQPREPTSVEYHELGRRIGRLYDTFFTDYYANDDTVDYVDSFFMLTKYTNNAGIPDPRFDMYMEFGFVLHAFNKSDGSQVDLSETYNLLHQAYRDMDIYSAVRSYEGTPFESATGAVFARVGA